MKMLMFDFRESEREFFETHDYPDIEITFIPESLNNETELTEEQFNDTDVISVFIDSLITEEVINKFKNLRIIATRSTGYNHIDIQCCTNNNIAVFNVERYGQTAVAQYTIGLVIALVRNLIPAYLDMERNIVQHSSYEGKNLENMTLGLIGGGAIGGGVAKIAHHFGMNILVYSYNKSSELTDIVEFVTFNELLERSDIISLHIPYTTENYHLLGAEEFKKMKEDVYIVNTARGELIDMVALYENIVSGKIKGAALDVLECEYAAVNGDNVLTDIKNENLKCINSALITQRLLDKPNVIITPHIAYNTIESVNTLLETTFNNIRDFSKGMHTNQVC